MSEKLFIPIIEGTIRPGRQSMLAAHLIEKMANMRDDITVQLIQPSDFNLPFDGNNDENRDPAYTDITARADGFIIVVPEYNHSYPGTLKRLLDSEFDNYKHKPVIFAGVSNGGWGGVRAIESLLHPVRTMGLITASTDIQFPRIQDLFDENGELKAENIEKYDRTIHGAINELVWLSTALKNAKQ
jgi:NAD(P)H-dependent FMN reductase